MKRLALSILVGALVAATALVAAPAGPATAQTGNDNTAVATNTKDNSFVFRFAFKVSRAAGDTVDAGNAAVAAASCSYCETVAVAIQVVLVSGSPSTVETTNVAIAYNENCYECVTLADAFQFVFGTGSKPVHLTPEGQRRLAEIRREYEQLRHSGLPPDQLQAEIERLAGEVYDVFRTELVPAGPPGASTSSSTAPPTTSAGSMATTSPPTTAATTGSTSPPTTSGSTATSAPADTTPTSAAG